MSRVMVRIMVTVLALTFFIGAHDVPAANATTAVSTDVVGDDNKDAYIGTGGLLLPSSFSGSGSTKRSVASCMGCVWKYTIYCASDSIDMCAHAVVTCPVGEVRYRAWFGKQRDELAVIGSVCWGSKTPGTRRDIENRLNDLVFRKVPALNIVCNPANDTLTSIPIICFTTQPTTFKPSPFALAFHIVRITAQAKWRWIWGDGTSEWRSVAGKPYPSTQITHQYRKAGDFIVSVESVWSASYTVGGVGTFQAGGEPITQDAQTGIRVHRAISLRTVSK